LDSLYKLSGYIASSFLFAIFVIVIIQVGFNIFNSLSQHILEKPVGLMIPSYSAFAGYFLGGATFFALAHTLQTGEHVRVTLVLGAMKPPLRKLMEISCCIIGLVLTATSAYFLAELIYTSWIYEDHSFGLVKIPLWIPQIPLFLGMATLTVAFLDNIYTLIVHGTATYINNQSKDQVSNQEETLP
jgi:TRAP-type C4-dicarboxylate transport system permease small subunit